MADQPGKVSLLLATDRRQKKILPLLLNGLDATQIRQKVVKKTENVTVKVTNYVAG